MLTLNTSFTIRFKTTLKGVEFFGETECANVEELTSTCTALHTHAATVVQLDDFELVAVEICFELRDLVSARNLLLDETSETILTSLLKELGVSAQHFWNERLGSYDPFKNVVEPVDFGIMFPDGTLRIVWRIETARRTFDDTWEILKGAVPLLLELQETKWGSETEDEFEASTVSDAMENRRLDCLFEAGLWPDSEGLFEPKSPKEQANILERFASRSPA